MQYNTPKGEEEDVIPENGAANGFPYGEPPFNFTAPEGDFNFTVPEGRFNFTAPEDGFNGGHPPFMGNLTDEQRTILNEKMQELRESGATQEEIMAAMRELMEEFGIQNP